jgi:hypothetical protein
VSTRNVLDTAIQTKLTAGTALTSTLGGTFIYNTNAVDEKVLPYVVFSQQAGGPDNITPSDSRDLVYFVRGYSESNSQAGTIDAQISALLHNQVLTVTGYTNYGLMRETDVSNYELSSAGVRTYMAGALYRIMLDQ